MGSINAIIFDLDGTLIDRDHAIFSWLTTILHSKDDISSCLKIDAGGYGNRTEFFAKISELNGIHTTTIANKFRNEFPSHQKPMQGAFSLLNNLKNFVKLGIASNGSNAMQSAKIKAIDWPCSFDCILISENIGTKKPNIDFFHALLQNLKCDPSKALFIGDHPINDIGGASSLGMRTCWLRSPHFVCSFHPDWIIDSLEEAPWQEWV